MVSQLAGINLVVLTQQAHRAKDKYRDNFLVRQIVPHPLSWRTRLATKHCSRLKITHTAYSCERQQVCIFWSQSKRAPSFYLLSRLFHGNASAIDSTGISCPPDTERWYTRTVPQEWLKYQSFFLTISTNTFSIQRNGSCIIFFLPVPSFWLTMLLPSLGEPVNFFPPGTHWSSQS